MPYLRTSGVTKMRKENDEYEKMYTHLKEAISLVINLSHSYKAACRDAALNITPMEEADKWLKTIEEDNYV